ncbi:uncharacterized protein UDID_19375 [Ustilago sp. UG-2017a]|nr:uncharacterized protein UDID_19375 [Ustilago sp. UG-2017a]SPC63412.1 uncharacterized protein UHOD_12338 [Ustilago sp. UG-2017b]
MCVSHNCSGVHQRCVHARVILSTSKVMLQGCEKICTIERTCASEFVFRLTSFPVSFLPAMLMMIALDGSSCNVVITQYVYEKIPRSGLHQQGLFEPVSWAAEPIER